MGDRIEKLTDRSRGKVGGTDAVNRRQLLQATAAGALGVSVLARGANARKGSASTGAETCDDIEVEVPENALAVADGPYDFGQSVDAEVFFQNASSCEITFYVEFVVRHFDPDYRDSNAPHGTTLTLSSGQWEWAELGWKVPPVAPSGFYHAYAKFYDDANVHGVKKPSTPIHTEHSDTGFWVDETPANASAGRSNSRSPRGFEG